MNPSLTSARAVIVSGKGGVGKTVVAAAVARAAAASGRRVLLLEVEGRNAIAPLFGVASLGYQEREVLPNLRAESVVPDEALVEYLYLFYGIKRIGRALAGTKAVEFATNVAPGLRDILLIGKVKEAERRRARESYAFDLIVVDAPPTGRLPRFLDAPRAVADLVRAGPIRQQAQGVLDMVTDPARCRVVLVTLAEDMSARETEQAAGKLERMGVALGPIVINRVEPDKFSSAEERALVSDARATVTAAAGRAGVALATSTIEVLSGLAGAQARRERDQRRVISSMKRSLGPPMVSLPALLDPVAGPEAVATLAGALIDQGALG